MRILITIIFAIASTGFVFALINRFVAKPDQQRQAEKLCFFFGYVTCAALVLPVILPVGGAV